MKKLSGYLVAAIFAGIIYVLSLYGKQFSTAQLAFVQHCVRAGYATFDGRTLALTPAGLIVQNSILAQLL